MARGRRGGLAGAAAAVAAGAAALLALAAAPSRALAQPYYGSAKSVFAQLEGVAPAKVVRATVFGLKGAAGYTHVMSGRYKVDTGGGESERQNVFLLKCGSRSCTGTRVWGVDGDQVDLVEVIDLEGKPGNIGYRQPARSGGGEWDTTLPSASKRMRWPVLVVRTRREEKGTVDTRYRKAVSGTARHAKLLLVSLRAADVKTLVVLSESTQDVGVSGAGHSTDYRTERGKQRVLDIIAREQRHLDNSSRCKEPDPIEYKLVLKDGRYTRLDTLAHSRGCH